MPQLAIPKSFFVKERENLYADWRTAFWREMFQNSLDAGASQIEANILELDDGDTVIEFIDNGSGMEPSTIEEVFFALGATTKENENGVGGFGRARILTCFANKSYEFWTHYHYCLGDGAMYEIEETDSFVRGCNFRINFGKCDASRITSALYAVLERSQLSCRVYVNAEQFTGWMHKQRLVKSEDFGNIHVNKSRNSGGQVVVRVKGLWTFSVHTSATPQIVVEIDPEHCREILTVNRDGMHYAYQNQLQSFLV